MRIKLNREQATGIFNLITYLLCKFPYQDRQEKITDILVNQIRIKLRNKVESRRTYPSYSITLSELEALGLEEWMEKMCFSIPSGIYVYEINEVTKVTNQINKIYG